MGLIADRYRTAALVKQDPLPPGRYWIDVFEKDIDAWVAWSGGNIATVHVEKTEFYAGTSKIAEILGYIYLPAIILNQPVMPDRAWIVFNVSAPTTWGMANRLGWPNTAPTSIQTSSDTSNAQQVIDDLEKENEDKWKWVKYSAYGLVGVVALYSLAKLVRG